MEQPKNEKSDSCVFVLDAHVHLYPCHDTAALLIGLTRRLQALAINTKNAMIAACLAEGAAFHWFDSLMAGSLELPPSFRVLPEGDSNGCRIETPEGVCLLLAGRQIVTAERLEALAPGLRKDYPDGHAVEKVFHDLRELGVKPVLSWAPGQWLGSRGRIVRRLIENAPPSLFHLGDTSLRPRGMREPHLMRLARKRGFCVLAGSDPLPFAGEEKMAGTYGCTVAASCVSEQPIASLRSALASDSLATRPVGARSSLLRVAYRLATHALNKRKHKHGCRQN